MLCIDNRHTDPYFNIASEEYLLKNYEEDIFMLYQNEPSVIVGKYQDVYSEVNIDFVERNKIKIVRRFSGGGTVFHDLGNLNLTFIETGTNLNFDKFTNQMIDILSELGINADSNERRAININGLKISGSAQCVHKNRVMYHATLLFSSDLASLETSVEGDPEQARMSSMSKKLYVKSVKSPVTNIAGHLLKDINIREFKQFIINHFIERSRNNRIYHFTAEDEAAINNLMIDKYATPEWNYHAQMNKCKSYSYK